MNIGEKPIQTNCQRCGTCCTNGGPALHGSDLALVKNHQLALSDLITIRQGEPVFSPLVNDLESAKSELIKISGTNNSWTCHFFDQETKGCGSYAYRPLECRLLKCWETSSITEIIYKDCLSRKDILPKDDNLWELINIQEDHCAFDKIVQLTTELKKNSKQEVVSEIARIVNLDLKIRQKAIQIRQLSLAEELLYFGRPLFKSLEFYQLAVKETPHGLTVIPSASFGT